MTGPAVHQLFRYPVKSMMGEALDTVEVGTSGVEGDRIWAVRDEKRGGIRGCLLYTSPSPRDGLLSRMPSSA